MNEFSLSRGWGCCLLVAVVLSTVFTIRSEATGEEQKLNKGTSIGKVEMNPVMSQAALAAELALRGEKRRSAVLLLAAAELLGELKESPRDIKTIKVEVPESSEADKQLPSLDVRELVRKAREYAKGDEKLSALVENRMEQLSSRGLTPTSQVMKLPDARIKHLTFKVLLVSKIFPGRYTELKNVQFEGGELAIVGVVGDGDGDLDLHVYDGNSGGLIGKDEDSTSKCQVNWKPRYRGPFTIRVKNVGQQWEKFVVLANW